MVLVLILLVLGALARFLPHMPNFTPVIAIALFGGAYLRRSQSLLLPLALMMATDLVIGLHPMVLFTWGSVLLISGIGLWARKALTWETVLVSSLGSAILFFIVTNFGVWLTYYPRTLEGLVSCYTLAIPFFRTTLASTLMYTVFLFGGHHILSLRIRNTRLAPVLLNK